MTKTSMAANQKITNHPVLAGKSGVRILATVTGFPEFCWFSFRRAVKVKTVFQNLTSNLRTSIAHGHNVGRGFDSRRVHQLALVSMSEGRAFECGGAINGVPVKFRQQLEQFCGPDSDSTALLDGGRLVPGMSTPLTVHQTKNAKSILAKAVSFAKSLFVMPDFGMAPAASLA